MANGCDCLSKGNKICSGFQNKDFDVDLWVTISAFSLYPFLFRFIYLLWVCVCVYKCTFTSLWKVEAPVFLVSELLVAMSTSLWVLETWVLWKNSRNSRPLIPLPSHNHLKSWTYLLKVIEIWFIHLQNEIYKDYGL